MEVEFILASNRNSEEAKSSANAATAGHTTFGKRRTRRQQAKPQSQAGTCVSGDTTHEPSDANQQPHGPKRR